MKFKTTQWLLASCFALFASEGYADITCNSPTGDCETVQNTNGAATSGAINAEAAGSGFAIIATSSTGVAVAGGANAPASYGVIQGENSSGAGWGVYGVSGGGDAVHGLYDSLTTTGAGVSGNSYFGPGVAGTASNGDGVDGTTSKSTKFGVFGSNTASLGYAIGANGVNGILANGTSGYGVWGTSQTGIGVFGTGPTGVEGSSSNGNGVYGVGAASGGSGVYGYNSSNAGFGVAGRISTTSTTGAIAIYGDANGSSGWAGYFRGNAYATGSFTSSDLRLKKNIEPVVNAINKVLELHGVTFDWKNPPAHERGNQMGFIAQDVEKVYPEWVAEDLDGFKTINTRGVDALLVESVRFLKSQNDELQNRVKALENRQSPSVAGVNANGLIGLTGVLALTCTLMLSRRRPVVQREE